MRQLKLRPFKELSRLVRAFFHPTFVIFALLGNGILFTATILVYNLEKATNPNMQTYFNSLWWGITTITTIGYGDVVPITFAGRLIGMGLMFTGPVLFILFTGVLLRALVREEIEKDLAPIETEIREDEFEQVRLQKTLDDVLKRLDQIEKKL